MKPNLLYGLLLLLFTGCKDSKEAVIAEEDQPFCLEGTFKDKVAFSPVQLKPVKEGIHLTGTVEVNPDKQVSFSSLVSGVVANTFFSLGERVTKGQVLAELRSSELSSLQAELLSINARIEAAQTSVEAVESMFNDGIATRKELAETKSELVGLKAEKQKVQNNLGLYSASQTKDVFLIKAPVSGIVTAKNINGGTQISAESEPLFAIADLNNVWVMASIYATNISSIKQGMQVDIRTTSYPDEVFKGKIDLIAEVMDEASNVLKARIVLDNQRLQLKPGMIADITALKPVGGEMVCINNGDVVFSNNENYVLVYKDSCAIEVRKIKIHTRNNEEVYIAEGLTAGEQIITQNQLLIFNRLGGY